jgi:hypothetical protein
VIEIIDLRIVKLNRNGVQQLQPFIIALGPEKTQLNSFYVVVSKLVVFQFESLLRAIDVCYKAIFVLNLKYSPDCAQIWFTLQRCFYDQKSAADTEYNAMSSKLSLIKEKFKAALEKRAT